MSSNELAAALATVLEPRLGPLLIANLRALTGGASRATWAFDAVTDTGSQALILRIGPPDEIHAGMQLEAAALGRAADVGAPVPRVLIANDSSGALGNPFLICEFIDGQTIVRRIHRALDDESRGDLLAQCARALAAIHRSDPSKIGLTTSDQLADWHAQLDAMGDTTAIFEFAFRWLAASRPAAGPNVLVHGDFRMGNLIVDTEARPPRLAAVLDWELTHAGEAYEDLAWFCIRAWRFGAPESLAAGGLGPLETFLRAYEDAAGTVVDRAVMRWWLIQSTLRWGVICRYQAERHLSGQTRSVELAAIGRRVCETEFDLLALLAGPSEPDEPGSVVGPASDAATSLHGRPTAAELVAAVAEFLDSDVRGSTTGSVTFHARVAVNALRMVERELRDDSAIHPRAALASLGFVDEAEMSAAIRRGDLDDRGPEVMRCLRALVRHRLAVAHPGYDVVS